jgi:hypothetical protein
MGDPWADYPGARPTDHRALRKADNERSAARARAAQSASERVELFKPDPEAMAKATESNEEVIVIVNDRRK